MRRLLCMMMTLWCLTSAQGQSSLKQHLKTKYDSCIEHTKGGKTWYEVSNGDGKDGACDDKGKELIPPQYDEVRVFYKDNYIDAKKNKKTFIFDLDGKLIIATPYDEVLWYQMKKNDYCEVERNGKCGVIDKQGKEIISCKYDAVDAIQSRSSGRFWKVKLNGKCGIADKKGKESIPCIYDNIKTHEFKDGAFSQLTLRLNGTKEEIAGKSIEIICEVVQKGKIGLITAEGEVLLPCGTLINYYGNFKDGQRYVLTAKGLDYSVMDGRIKQLKKNGKWGVYDMKLKKLVVPYKYDCVKEQDGIFIFNLGGSPIIYQDVIDEELKDLIGVEGGKWGIVDATGKELIAAQYDLVGDFKDGVAQVKKDGITSLLTHPLQGTALKVADGDNTKVDTEIPVTDRKNENTFAFVIGNENYTHFSGADFSINDGKVFAEYCKKTLGLPENNIRYYEDATYGTVVNAVKKMQDIADVYEGDAKLIFYFSGLGATDEKSANRYLLPTDASLASLSSTGYNVEELFKTADGLNVTYTWIILDAPFSNIDKSGKTLANTRGVALRPKTVVPQGLTVCCQASQGEQTAFSCQNYGHSLFTYALLDKMRQTKGNCTLKDLTDYAISWVKKTSLSTFNKVQTPSIAVSEVFSKQWGNTKP